MRYQKFLYASDLHGTLQHKPTVKALLDFKSSFKPDLTIFGGDLVDLQALLRKATDEDRAIPIIADVQSGMEFAHNFKPNVLMYGNHDHRLWVMAGSRDAVKRDLANHLISDMEKQFSKIGCKVVPYGKRQGVYKLGNLTFIHGYAAGIGAARKHALIYGNVMHGHTHSIDCVSIETHNHVTARSVGCLCELDMDYNLSQPGSLRHAHGFAYGVSDTKTGRYYAVQAQEIEGKWFCPTEFNL